MLIYFYKFKSANGWVSWLNFKFGNIIKSYQQNWAYVIVQKSDSCFLIDNEVDLPKSSCKKVDLPMFSSFLHDDLGKSNDEEDNDAICLD